MGRLLGAEGKVSKMFGNDRSRMAPKELTRHQLSSKLAYNQHTPAFLLKLQNRIAGRDDDEEDDYDDAEFEDVGSGRPPIPRRPRPPIPERPADDPGSADEDADDEKPQVVVLKEGKHLTELEAENIRRKEKGLPPLDDANTKPALKEPGSTQDSSSGRGTSGSKQKSRPTLSFSSARSGTKPSHAAKRKAINTLDDLEDASSKKAPVKKKKKESKTLLSFGDDA